MPGGEREKGQRFIARLASYGDSVQQTLAALDSARVSERLTGKDPSLWKQAEETKRKIENRLGWMSIVAPMLKDAGKVAAFSESVLREGFRQVVLLGMGGSSLCPEVCAQVFGKAPGYPDLFVLDTTDPASILGIEKSLDLAKTLFIVASKSGTTLEVQALSQYFFERVRSLRQEAAGTQFIAITDPQTPLEDRAKAARFRKVYLAPPDIGGRYSALSYFGLVPASLIGIDLIQFLRRAEEMVHACGPRVAVSLSPGIHLGAILGSLGRSGRDKITFLFSPQIESFGSWAEQLLAESTGKEGKGLIPVVGEPLAEASSYGPDRLFIHMGIESEADPKRDTAVRDLSRAGHPIIQILLRDVFDLAGEFFRWEMAAAVAGAVLEVNPFDEPNVTESKENTQRVLQEFQATGRLPEQNQAAAEAGISLYAGSGSLHGEGFKEKFWNFVNQAEASHYLAIMAYLSRSEIHERLFERLRKAVRDRRGIATTLGYGPRFLHSTGQLHKGGPRNGIFVQITAEDREDISIPGAAYTFGVLKSAQALGDFRSLADKGLPVLRVHLRGNTGESFKILLGILGVA